MTLERPSQIVGVLPVDDAPLSLVSPGFRKTAAKTRLANATPYSAGDVISEHDSTGTAWNFADVFREVAGKALLTSVQLTSSIAPALPLWATLHLFHTAQTGINNDNLANTVVDGDVQAGKLVASIEFVDYFSLALNRVYVGRFPNGPVLIEAAAADTDLYGLLVANNAYVPGSGEVLAITVGGVQL